MSFNDFIKKYNLKNRATSNIKLYEVLKKIGLDSKVGIFLRDGDFSTIYGVVNLHPSRGTLRVCYMKDCYFDSFEFSPPQKNLKNLKNNHRKSIYFENQIQKNDSFCERFCLYIIYLIKVMGFIFKSAVLNSYYQRFS